MNILVADYSGFCFGVKNAVSKAYNTSSNKNGNVYTFGPIIHNPTVVNELEQKGITQLPSLDILKDTDTVVIRSHGVSKEIIQALKSKNVSIIDATCPYVGYIHKRVEEYYNNGYQIIIIGDSNHPEVEGISGWCDNSAVIVDSLEQISNLKKFQKACIVAQTTISNDKWRSIVSSLLFVSKEIVVLNTICSATEQRQNSAKEIAEKCDAVIVLGGYNSSNTKKLSEICKKYCNKTYHIENINELSFEEMKDVNVLGITAGASTPDWIIKEAIDKMSDLKNTNEEGNEQELLLGDYEKTFVRIHAGDIVTGRIIYANEEEASVDISYKADGLITKEEASISGDISPKELFKPGDEVEVLIITVNDGEGNVLLSKKAADAEKNIEYIEKIYTDKTVVDAKVVQIVKGGVITEVKGVQVFIPASQLDNKYVEDLSSFIKKDLKIVITDFVPDKKKVVGSRRLVLTEEAKHKKQDLLDNLKSGDIVSGTVSRITDFGVFVDLGGMDGLIHVSELSWTRIKHPSEVLKAGDTVEVYVLSVEKEKERVSLSLRKTVSEPWDNIESRIHVGDIVQGKVLRLAPFGAFVQLEPGVDGLVHISQISDKRINKVEDALKIGEIVKVKVTDLNVPEKKISLSIKDAVEDEVRKENDAVLESQEQNEVTIKDIMNSKDTE